MPFYLRRLITGASLGCALTIAGAFNAWGAATDIASLQAAAAKGDVQAQTALAMSYHKGKGVTKNDEEAAKWFRAAADKGNARAQEELGKFYMKGMGGLAKDEATGVQWYFKAAVQNDPVALGALGLAYCKGTGVEKNTPEGIKLIRLAAERGDARSQEELGKFTLHGICTPKDSAEAYMWFTVALAQPDAAIPDHRNEVNDLQPAQIEAAKQKAAQWLAQHPVAAKPKQ